jgi:hypothetical protein
VDQLTERRVLSVTGIECVAGESYVELRARLSGEDLDGFELWFRYPTSCSDAVCACGDPFVAALLLPVMARGAALRVEGPVSSRMMQGVGTFMDVICGWWPEFEHVAVEADETDVVRSTPDLGFVASSFSGGVDSFYTLLKNEHSDLPRQEKISRLLFIHGYDIALDRADFHRAVVDRLEVVAKACDKELIQVSTNARQLAGEPVTWGRYHATVLIAVTLGLQGRLRRLYIPASYPYADLFPWGSHPRTDPLWSTESLEIIHDGCEATRVEKVLAYVSKSQVALDNLRVCWESQKGMYNCGVCEKCMRTKLNLEIAGVLHKAGALDSTLRYKDVKKMRVYGNHAERFARDNLQGLIAHGGDPRLIKALRKALSPWSRSGRKQFRRKLTRPVENAFKRMLRPLAGWVGQAHDG